MKVIAVTGGIAMGKSTLVSTLRALGAEVIDADAISRSLTASGGAALPAIRQAFGKNIFSQDGQLNRKMLGKLIFTSPTRRAQLNNLLHPMIRTEMEKQLAEYKKKGARVVVLDVPLLYECHMENMADEVWATFLPQNIQLKRLVARDGLTYKEARSRIHSQMPALEKARRANCVIRTNGTIQETSALSRAQWEKSIGKQED